MQRFGTFVTLAALALAVFPMTAHAADPNSCTPLENGVTLPACDDNSCAQNGVTGNLIVPAPGAAFSVAPSTVHPTVGATDRPVAVGAQHVAGRHQADPTGTTGGADTPPADTPPADSGQRVTTPAQDPGVSAQNPGAVTNWLPDCITINSGDEVQWSNADGEAVHFDILGACTNVANKALQVPGVDLDQLKFRVTRTGGVVTDIFVTGFWQRASGAGATTLIAQTHCNKPDARDTGTFGGSPPAPYLWKDMGGYVDLIYTCGLHHSAMMGHIHIKY